MKELRPAPLSVPTRHLQRPLPVLALVAALLRLRVRRERQLLLPSIEVE